ncbi:MAG: CvpA family protein [bacterium]
MNYIDFIIIIITAIGFILGFKDGLVRKIIGLIGLALGFYLAVKFSSQVGKFIGPFFSDDVYLAEIIAGLLIFLTIILIASIVKRIIHPLDKVNKFLNQLLGGIAGTIQILYFISAFLLILKIFDVPSKNVRNSSLLYNKTYNILPFTIDLILGKSPDAKDFLRDFIESKDKELLIKEPDSTNIKKIK